MVAVPGFNEALVYVFKDDNQGPPVAGEVAEALRCIEALFPPGASMEGSTFDAFVDALLTQPGGGAVASLPTLTSEIGDTWIFGAASDPRRQKIARLMKRERSACVAAGTCDPGDPAIANFSRFLLKTAEHTFGLHAIPETHTWDNAARRAALADPASKAGALFKQSEVTWTEQRLFLDYARQALTEGAAANHASAALGRTIDAAIARAAPTVPPTGIGRHRVAAGETVRTAFFDLVVSNVTGGLSSLVQRSTGKQLLLLRDGHTDRHTDLFQFIYRTSNQSHDFTPFRNNFTGDWQTFPGTWFSKQPGSCYDKPVSERDGESERQRDSETVRQ